MPITLYQHPLSGHSHRVRLFLSLLNLKADIIDVNLKSGAHKSPEFLARNAFGQVPVLIDGEVIIADSNAILVYLALRYDDARAWLPQEPKASAAVQRFLSVAAGQLASGPASARLVNVFGAALDHERAVAVAISLLAVLEKHLASRDWLVGESATIADVANYAYLAHAPEGGVDLQPFPEVRGWLRRIEALRGFVPMRSTAVGLAA